MKKIIFLFLFLFTLFQLTSCNSDNSNLEDNKEDSSDENNSIISGKAIVVYFSATNNTKRISNVIANHLEIPLFELVPVVPYSSSDLNYNDPSSRVSKEHNDPNRYTPLTSITINDFDSYKYIFIGYPIWWGEASWVLDEFVKQTDFTGKTIIPFATSVSSPLGNSAKHLAEKSSNGTWLEGVRFYSSATSTEITEWIQSLNL